MEREVFGRAPGRFARNLTLVRSPHGESPLMMLAAVTTRRLIAYQSHFLPHVVMLGVLTVFWLTDASYIRMCYVIRLCTFLGTFYRVVRKKTLPSSVRKVPFRPIGCAFWLPQSVGRRKFKLCTPAFLPHGRFLFNCKCIDKAVGSASPFGDSHFMS